MGNVSANSFKHSASNVFCENFPRERYRSRVQIWPSQPSYFQELVLDENTLLGQAPASRFPASASLIEQKSGESNSERFTRHVRERL